MNTLSILDAESSNIPEGLYLKLVNALKTDFNNNNNKSDSDEDEDIETEDDEPISDSDDEPYVPLHHRIVFNGVFDKWDVIERLFDPRFEDVNHKQAYFDSIDFCINSIIWYGDNLMCENIECTPFDILYYNIVENYDNIQSSYNDFIFNNNVKECKFICAGGCPIGNYFCTKTYKYFCWSHLKHSYQYIDRPNLIRTNCCGFNILRQEACSVIGTELAHNNKMYCWRHIVDA